MLVSVSHFLYYAGQFTQGVISACKRGLFKVMVAIIYFCHSKSPSNIMKNNFNSISIYSQKNYPSQQTEEANVL